jgi:hypothetical protein
MSAEQATGVSYADPGEAAASFRCARTCALCVPDVGPIRRVVEAGPDAPRRYLVILTGLGEPTGQASGGGGRVSEAIRPRRAGPDGLS